MPCRVRIPGLEHFTAALERFRPRLPRSDTASLGSTRGSIRGRRRFGHYASFELWVVSRMESITQTRPPSTTAAMGERLGLRHLLQVIAGFDPRDSGKQHRQPSRILCSARSNIKGFSAGLTHYWGRRVAGIRRSAGRWKRRTARVPRRAVRSRARPRMEPRHQGHTRRKRLFAFTTGID